MAQVSALRCGRLLAALAVLMAVAVVRSEHSTHTVPPPPVLPQRFQISFHSSDTQSSPFENQGALVTVARDGNYVGIHFDDVQSSVYYRMDCAKTDTVVSSVQTSWFATTDAHNGEGTLQRQCWYAPAGNYVKEGEFQVILELFKAWALQSAQGWDFGGYLRNYNVRMHLWSRMASLKSRHEIAYNTETGEPMEMVLIRNNEMYVWNFVNGSMVTYPQDHTPVSLAHPPALDNCTVMPTHEFNYGSCSGPASSAHSLRRSMQTGEQADFAPNAQELDSVLDRTSTGAKPSDGRGRYAKPYTFLGQATHVDQFPETFFPPLSNKDKPDVRNQRMCGSCWSFATAASLSSVYSNKHGVHYTFSTQYLADCLPKDEGIDSGTGCWGAFVTSALDYVIASGSVVPLDQDYPYLGVQGQCAKTSDGSTQGVALNVTGYSILQTPEQAMDALMNRGAIAVSLQAGGEFDNWGSSAKAYSISDLIDGNVQALSCQPNPSSNHAVNVIGWAPCQVRTPGTTAAYAAGRCWIVQNSWGPNAGIEGLWLINMDAKYDCGISGDMIVPLLA